jgi:integrase/recombinase XerC
MDWGIAVGQWTAELRAAGQSEKTIGLRRSHLQQLALARGAGGRWLHPDPLAMTRGDVIAWMGRRVDTGGPMAPETRKSWRSTLRGFFGYLVEAGLRDDDPAGSLRPVRVPMPDPRPADDSDIVEAMRQADPRTLLMIRLGAECGMRRAEIASADNREIRIDGLHVVGKGGRHRTLPLPRDLRAVLEALPDGWVFPSPGGGHLTPGHVGKLISAVLPDGTTPHQLRHAAATAWHELGLSLLEIRELLGHASVRTTQIYVRTRSAAARAAVEDAAARLHRVQRPAARVRRLG